MNKAPRYWKPLVRAVLTMPHPEAVIDITMRERRLDREAAIAHLDADDANCEIWVNDHYQVQKRRCGGTALGLMYHLNIRRRDGAPIHDWRHLQQIKNELMGEECEAVELYPAESRLVDTSNKYHLWCFPGGGKFPFGFDVKQIRESDETGVPGLRQRKM